MRPAVKNTGESRENKKCLTRRVEHFSAFLAFCGGAPPLPPSILSFSFLLSPPEAKILKNRVPKTLRIAQNALQGAPPASLRFAGVLIVAEEMVANR